MRVQIAGRQVDVGEALSQRISEELSRGVTKYFSSRPAEATVTVSRQGPFFGVDCSVHLDSGIYLQAEGRGGDAHSAFEDALEKIEKRVRRYKRRLKNHQASPKDTLSNERAPAYVLAPADEEPLAEDDDAAGADEIADAGPLVIAESTVAVPTMAVSTAVLQLELAESPALLFRNAAHGGLNLVYRRADGNIGWVDPERATMEKPNGVKANGAGSAKS
jgi:ribosomal subunit interface protein